MSSSAVPGYPGPSQGSGGPGGGRQQPQTFATPGVTPSYGPPQPSAGALPGAVTRTAPAEAVDQLMRLMGQGLMMYAQELVQNGINANSTTVQRGRSMVSQVQRELAGLRARAAISSGSNPRQSEAPVALRSANRGPADNYVDPMTGMPMARFAGEGDRGMGQPRGSSSPNRY